MPTITLPAPSAPAPNVNYGTCRCVCPGCKSGNHCAQRVNNCGYVG